MVNIPLATKQALKRQNSQSLGCLFLIGLPGSIFAMLLNHVLCFVGELALRLKQLICAIRDQPANCGETKNEDIDGGI